MGLWDKIKDGLTTDKAETAEDVREKADKAQADAEKWDKKADDAAAEAGTAAPEAPAPAPTEAPAPPAPPAAPAEAPKKKKPQMKTYTVKSGDTLSEIGAHFGVDWHDIARINDIENPDLIFPGQVFKIPNR